jgi:hypothetical protein
MNGSNFSKDLKHFGKAFLPERSSDFFRKVTLAAYQGVITTSPVDTGRFRLSWRVSVNTVNTTVSDEPATTSSYRGAPAGAPEISASGLHLAITTMKEAKNVNNIFISNNLPYATALEQGHSDQAKNGIVRLVAQQLKYKLATIK